MYNDESAKISLGSGSLYYCGRRVGVRNLPNSDGTCGPYDGPQCASCHRFQTDHVKQILNSNSKATLKPSTSTIQNNKTFIACYYCNEDIKDGLRYQCEVCFSHMCEKCLGDQKHDLTHRMLIFSEPKGTSVTFLCDACRIGINGQRWRCTVCPSFDLCSSCHNRSRWPACHLGTHKMLCFTDFLKDKKTMLVNISFTCDVCNCDIIGTRIHCNNCMNFDLCENCFKKKKTVEPHSTKHVVSAFEEPGSIPLNLFSTSQLSTANVGVVPKVKLAALSGLSSGYSTTKKMFFDTWVKDLHIKALINVKAVCRVENTVLNASYEVYKKKLISDKLNPNKKLLWHGTALQCDLYNNKFKTCHSANCAVCNIVENNFILSRAQSNIVNFGRFGNGIYFSPCSSKSHDYNDKSEKHGIRAMLLCKVIVGNTYVTQVNMQDLQGPPGGYHSVTGEPGIHLNYPEVVVWEERAISPQFVIFYSYK